MLQPARGAPRCRRRASARQRAPRQTLQAGRAHGQASTSRPARWASDRLRPGGAACGGATLGAQLHLQRAGPVRHDRATADGVPLHARQRQLRAVPRTIAPSWICTSIGYADPTLIGTANTIMPTIEARGDNLASEREPGAQRYEQVGHTAMHLLFPAIVCLMLLLHTLGTTISFAGRCNGSVSTIPRRLASRARAWVARQDPPRATTSPTSLRRARRHSRSRSSPTISASNFCSTMGEAPLWLSIVFLVHEITVYVIPCLFALSIGTLAAGVLRFTHSSLRAVCGGWLVTPARVLLRVTVNVVAITMYLGYHLLVNTFVSESSVWPPVISSSPSRSRLHNALHAVAASVRALASTTCMDLRRWGGVALDNVLALFSPTPTDPSTVEYTASDLGRACHFRSTRRPRALHAYNDQASADLLARAQTYLPRRRNLAEQAAHYSPAVPFSTRSCHRYPRRQAQPKPYAGQSSTAGARGTATHARAI